MFGLLVNKNYNLFENIVSAWNLYMTMKSFFFKLEINIRQYNMAVGTIGKTKILTINFEDFK